MNTWIFELPEWQEGIVFEEQWVLFFLGVVLLFTGFALSFIGYKQMQALSMVALTCLLGMTGFWLGERMTQNAVLKMYFFVVFLFVGTYFLKLLLDGLALLMKKRQVYEKLLRKQYLIAAPLGAAITSGVLYCNMYRSLPVVWGLFAGLTIVGILWGKKRSAQNVIFYTYDDLYHRKPLEAERDSA